MKKLTLLPLLFTVLLPSCSKDDDGGSQTDSPSIITITLPGAGIIYVNGATLRVEGEMSDVNGLATAKLEIINRTSGGVLFQQSNPTGNVSFYRFTWNWPISGITTTTPAKVKVTATDKLNNQVSKEVEFILDN